MDSFVVATTTTPDREAAERIAAALVERGLAACAQVGGAIRSWYRWQGKLERSDEVLVLIKTRTGRIPAIRELLREMHPYEVPELVASPITAGSPDYLAWVEDSLPEE